MSTDTTQQDIPRQSMDVDIACVGFGPAMGGFLTTLTKGMTGEDGMPIAQSKAMPGMPPQVICYERADDMGFGVSGVVTRARAIKESFPDLDPSQIPMAAPVDKEKVLYLLDPDGVSRRSFVLRMKDASIRALKFLLPYENHALSLPFIPGFLQKHGGWVMSIGQFNSFVGSQVMGSGMAQIWPGTPVDSALTEDGKVTGVRLIDQGVNKKGEPDVGFMPGMDIKARLTVVGDGPVGAVGRQLDRELGLPEGNHQRDYAVGMKMVVELPEDTRLTPGTVLHTLGYPEPEIFGFLYVYPERIASLGIFVPSWFKSPVRTAYRYLQHWMLHPYMWRRLKGSTLRSWGAKSLQESGKRGEPHLAGDGFARIGEGSGSTNVLTGSGVDEAWATGVMLGESVLELLAQDKEFTRANLEATYVKKRREHWVDKEADIAARARDGFHSSVVKGLIGMAMTGFSKGALNWPATPKRLADGFPTIEEYFKGRISPERIEEIRTECTAKGRNLHDRLMTEAGWPKIEMDGKLLISHQDALLMGGKVQANPGYRDHVIFKDSALCESCNEKVCIEACSGQAITTNPDGGVPLFDREKCVHCGACLWNCVKADDKDPERTNIRFISGSGGLHSAEN